MPLSLGPPEMGQQQDLGAGIGQLQNGRRNSFHAGEIGRPAIGHGQVEIDANQRDLALDVAEIVEGLELRQSGLRSW